ncbi:MAG: hypothetical protein KW793_04715, partial [Candidatus Doudnabacteria bacterium]|nr:hypothetical protein [Candidatus Doudnabacteria bacterium]
MTPLSRFTFFHSSLPVEGLVVENPIGWDTAVISLERHKNYHSLIEYFKGNFMWYGLGMSTLKEIQAGFGFNTVIGLEIDISFKIGVYTNIFIGQVKLPTSEEIIIADREDYKITAPILREDFWTKFINRSDSQVNLEGVVDLDGNARTAVNKIVLPMPSQRLRTKLDGYIQTTPFGFQIWSSGDCVQVDVDTYIFNEVGIKNNLPVLLNTGGRPGSLIDAQYAGSYDFDISFDCSLVPDSPIPNEAKIVTAAIVTFFIQINDDAAIPFSITDFVEAGINEGFSRFEYTGTHSLNVGDRVRIYGRFLSSQTVLEFVTWGLTDYAAGDLSLIPPWPSSIGSYIRCTADTSFVDTETDAYLIKDAAESIISKLVGQNAVVKSDYLDTCKGHNAIFRGKHVRGYDFATKQFSMSWEEWWKGADPLLFLGLSYTEVLGVKKIEIEDRAYFYDATPVVNISNVNKLVRRYDLEKIYKSIP